MDDERVAALAAWYGNGAVEYQELWAPVLLPLTAALLDRLPLADAHLVVDVGTGVGAAIPQIKERAPQARVIAVDRSLGMLREARLVAAPAAMDATRLALASEVADVVLAAFMLFHLPDPLAGLREMHRVLKPEGTLGLVTWGADIDAPAWTIWEEELVASGAAPPDPKRRILNHDLMDTEEKLRSLVDEAGFSGIRIEARPLDFQPDLRAFVELQVRYASRERLASLPDSEREGCVQRAMTRLRALPPEGFRDPSEVLLAIATA